MSEETEKIEEQQEESNVEELEVTNEITDEIDEYEESYIADEELPEVQLLLKKQRGLKLIVIGLLVISSLSLISLFLRYYPLTSKLEGTWESESNYNMSLKTTGKTSRLTVGSFSGIPNLSVQFEGELGPKGKNLYQLTNTEIYLIVDISEMEATEIKKLKEEQELYTLTHESKRQLTFKYTKKGQKTFFGTNDIDRYFSYSLENFKGLTGQEIYLNNSQLSESRIVFTKKEPEDK